MQGVQGVGWVWGRGWGGVQGVRDKPGAWWDEPGSGFEGLSLTALKLGVFKTV